MFAFVLKVSYKNIYRVPKVFANRFCVERTKPRRKILYHFIIFAIVNKILITKNCQILIFLLKYQFYRKRDQNHLFSSYKVLRIFLEFFINFLVLNFFVFTNMRKYGN